MSENACKVGVYSTISTTGTAFPRTGGRVWSNAADLRSVERRFIASSNLAPCIDLPAEHGWFMHRPCKSGFLDSNSGVGFFVGWACEVVVIRRPLHGLYSGSIPLIPTRSPGVCVGDRRKTLNLQTVGSIPTRTI